MNNVKLFEQWLYEFKYGKSLFADSKLAVGSEMEYKDFIKRVTGSDEEPNTPDEEELWVKLHKYITTNNRLAGDSGLTGNDLKPLIPLKKKFPGILDPEYGGKLYRIYRGMSMDIDELVSLIKKGKVEVNDRLYTWKMDVSTKITSRSTNGFLSFSANERNARSFAKDNSRVQRGNIKNGRWPIVAGVLYKSIANDCLFNHRFIDQIHNYGEEEILYVGNSFQTDVIEILFPESIYNVNRIEEVLSNLRNSPEGKTVEKLLDAINNK
jgi:hypothetical protein